MYGSHFKMVYNQLTEGITIKIIRQDEDVVMTEITFKKGSVFPDHIHFSDHSGYLLKGRLRISRNGVPRIMMEGDSWCMGKKVPHFTEALEDSVVIEVYSIEKENPEQIKTPETLAQKQL